MHLTHSFSLWTKILSLIFFYWDQFYINTAGIKAHTCTHTGWKKRLPYLHYLWACKHFFLLLFSFLSPTFWRAVGLPLLHNFVIWHCVTNQFLPIHLISSRLGDDLVSPLTWNGAALLSELLTNWPVMGVMDAALSCLPPGNLHVGLKCLFCRILGSEGTQLQLLMELLVQVPQVNGSINKIISAAKCMCFTLIHGDKKGMG